MSGSFAVVLALLAWLAAAQTPLDALKAESDASRRAEHGLTLAENEFESARAAYVKGDIRQGDDRLDLMTRLLDESVKSFEQAHKSRLYKRAEQRVAHLQRRLNSLNDDVDVLDRGWVEQTGRQLAELHERLLKGVMSK